MTGKEIQVSKLIVWRVSGLREELIDSEVEIESPSTSVLIGSINTKWTLSFFPNNVNTIADASYLNLKEKTSANFEAKFIMGIKGKKGNKESEEKTFDSVQSWVSATNFPRSEIYDPQGGYLIDGKLTLYCKLTITAPEDFESENTSSSTASLSENFVSQFKRMMNDDLFSDFEVETANGVLKANQTVLSVRSPFFFGMLSNDMAERNNKKVKVTENSEIMQEVLRFIYCNEVENLSVLALELLEASDKYQLHDLKKICIDSIIKSLDADNVLTVLLFADRLNDTQRLKDKCFDYIASNMHFIQGDAPEWKTLPQKLCLELIFSKNKDTIYV